jgi:signal transduction histidine kinase
MVAGDELTELHRSQSLLLATIESTADGLLVIDMQGKVVLYNSHFIEMWRIPPDVLEPRDDEKLLRFVLDQLVDPDYFMARVHELYAQPELESFDVLRFRDGRWFERFSKPQRIAHRTVGRVWSFRDITQRRQFEDALHRSVRARDEFLSIASHELYTPIHSLTLAVDALAQHRLDQSLTPDQYARMIHLATRQVDRLTKLVGTLLDVTRVDADQLVLAREAVDLGDLVTAVADSFASEVARQARLLAVNAQAGVVGNWDRSRLEQVLTNLMSNALKFGQGNQVEISLVREDAPTGARAVVRVVDHGIGIDPADIDRLFERFARAVPSSHFGGLGLGLYVSRLIVQAHGGTLDATSQLGAGSTFTMTLPIEES